MTDAEFLQWLRDQNPYMLALVDRGDGMWVSLERLMFHHTIKLGVIGDTNGYEDRWCVGDLPNAMRSWEEWASRGFQGEPTGWNRHPSSGRRRTDGDPARE
jgi:hypothetical protein